MHNFLYNIADSNGKNEQKLFSLEVPNGISQNHFSPDGKSIAYSAGQTHDGKNDYRLMKIDLKSGQESTISEKKFYLISNLAWMPNSKDLLLTARETKKDLHKIWKINGDSGNAIKVNDIDKFKDLSLDKSGEKILVTQLKTSFQLSLFSLTNPNERKILASAFDAKFLSDNEIAYTTIDEYLWKIGLDGRGQRQLTNKDSLMTAPLPTNDGNHYYVKSFQNDSNQIWRIDSDGSNQIQITQKVGGVPKFVSQNGKELFFESDFHHSVWKITLDGNSLEEEVWDKEVRYSAFTKDGSKIAYLARNDAKSNRYELEIANFAGKAVIKTISLAEKGLRPIRVQWLNDNETLLFITGNETGYKLWKQKINSDSAELVADLGKEKIRSFSISPNSENILIVSGEWFKDVILIENFK